MQTANPKTAQTTTGGNTHTTYQAPEVRRVRTAPGQLSDWQEAPQAAPAVVPVTVKPRKVAQVAASVANRPAWADLTFIKTRYTRYGTECLDWLAVPLQTYSEGWITGLRVMDELMAHVNATRASGQHYGAEHALQSVIAAACAELTKPMSAQGEGKDKRGAAQAVIHCMTRFMVSVDMVSVGG